MTRPRYRVYPLALTVLVGAALAGNGCGGGDDARTNGLETMPAAKVQQMAADALRSASSAHVTGTSVVDGAPTSLDLRFDGSSSTGTLAAGGVRLAITRIGDEFFVKADRAALRQLGASPELRKIGAGRWLELGGRQITQWTGFSLAELAGQLSNVGSRLEAGVTQSTLDGRPVVVLRWQDGSKLYVANTGAPYPLRGEYRSGAAGRIEFAGYGAASRIAAPVDAVDVRELTGSK
jgi:hypothetical protein